MTDVLVIFTRDKKIAAERIAQASRAAGYEAALAEIGTDGAGAAEHARGVPAALLVWSRPLVSSAMIGNWLAGLRQLPNLIEVSTDGIAPDTGDTGRVVLLSGWRGQSHHLGWQRIVDDLKRLHAPRPMRTAAQRPPPGESTALPGREEVAVLAAKGRRFAVPALAAAAALAAVGAVIWQESGAPARRGDPVAVAPAVEPDQSRARQAEPGAAFEPAAAAPATPAPGPVPEGSGESVSLARPSPTRKAARPTKPTASATHSAAAVSVKRYSKRYSKTMRLFCARSGRSTPECRTYLRSVQASRD